MASEKMSSVKHESQTDIGGMDSGIDLVSNEARTGKAFNKSLFYRWCVGGLLAAVGVFPAWAGLTKASPTAQGGPHSSKPAPVSAAAPKAPTDACVDCHTGLTRGIVADWKTSRHFTKGVSCLDCHNAEGKNRPDVEDHFGKKIVMLVTPTDCGKCHEREATEFQASHHAKAAQVIGSLDNVLGEIVGGSAATNTGCKQCHGSTVKVLADGKLDPQTWPNTGVGRVNPDGSNGSCSACHARHSFSVAVARQPESCGRCHMGPDHPQAEIYAESKHGILFTTHRQESHLDNPGNAWRPGRDYHYPTCAGCHMSAAGSQQSTHDVGTRLSWTLRPPVSKKMDDADAKRGQMREVCETCHTPGYVDNFYAQYDSQVDLYNEKFGKPATAIMDQLQADKKLTPTPFDAKIKWTYYLLWHHEGRAARMGAAMMGPDYSWWHGMFNVAQDFYSELLPQAEQLEPGISKPILDSPFHQWQKGLSKEQNQQILDFYQQRYKQPGQ